MTTWESTDNVEVMDNITITSDAAYERVTSDEHFEEEKNWGYLQQNTSWLVQEIPNIAFIDIADTMLESKKTLYDRENWILRVWEKGRSIEVQPQDTVTLLMNADYNISQSWEHYIEFDSTGKIVADNCENVNNAYFWIKNEIDSKIRMSVIIRVTIDSVPFFGRREEINSIFMGNKIPIRLVK